MAQYAAALQVFEALIQDNAVEAKFQTWFEDNYWVFGTDYIARANVRRIGLREIPDLCVTCIDGYQDFVELKRPKAVVLLHDDDHDSYYPSSELSKSIAQCINYLRRSQDIRDNLANRTKLPFLRPRARIVIGDSTGWLDPQKDALRLLNAELSNIEIRTFDQVLAQGRRLIELYELGPDQIAGDGNEDAI